MAWLLVPAAISSTIGTLNVMIGMRFTSQLSVGDISVFDIANKLIQLPLGILMTALLIPLFPMLTRAVVDGDRPELFRLLDQGLTTITLATLPLIAFFAVAGQPLVATVFEHGAFNADATLKTAAVLTFGSLGIFTYAARDLFIRVFLALGDSRTPLIISVSSLVLTACFMAAAIGPFGLNGLAAATSGVTVVNFCLVILLLRHKLGELPLRGFLLMFVRGLVAALAAGAAAWLASHALDQAARQALGPAFFASRFGYRSLMVGSLAVDSLVGGLAYVLALAVVGLPVFARLKDLAGRVGGRLRPARG